MLEGRKEFGLRNRKEAVPQNTESPEITTLRNRLAEIMAHQEAGSGILQDEHEKERILKRIAELRGE